MSSKVRELLDCISFDEFIRELSTLREKSLQPPTVKCSICSRTEHSDFESCVTCLKIFCSNCSKNTQLHRCKVIAKRPIELGTDLEAHVLAAHYGTDECPAHKSQERLYFCESCNIPLCFKCVMLATHHGHDVKTRADFVASKKSEFGSISDYAQLVDKHQNLSARICLQELNRLKTQTERDANVWLGFLKRIVQFMERFIQKRVADLARARAQHLAALGAVACNSVATNRLLIRYLESLSQADEESIDGILAHRVYCELKDIANQPAVITGFNKKESVIEETELFDEAATRFKDVLEEVARKLGLEEDSSMLEKLVTLQKLTESSCDDLELNENYKFWQSDEQPAAESEGDNGEVKHVSFDIDTKEIQKSIEISSSKKSTSEGRSVSMTSSTNLFGVVDTQQHQQLSYPSQLAVENGEHVRLTWLKSPVDFYVTKLRSTSILSQIDSECNSYAKSREARGISYKIGMPVLAVFGDQKHASWYRGAIVKERINEATLERELLVFYVDYGNKEWIGEHSRKIHSISSKLLSLAPQAIRCCLSNISSVDDSWSTQAIVDFENMFGTLPATVCVCKEAPDATGRWHIDLYRGGSKDSKAPESFRDALVFMGHGRYPEEVIPKASSATAKSGFVPKKPLKVDEAYAVFISHFDNPFNFYVHVLGEESNNLTQLNKSVDAFARAQSRSSNRSMPALRMGLPVICPYIDGKWYRAVVLRRNAAQNKVVVRFIDYGNESLVETKVLLDIPEEFMTLPAQAVRCRLHGVKPTSSSGLWPDVERYFQSKSNEGFDMLVVEKIRSGLQYLVEMFETNEDLSNPPQSVGNTLIAANLAASDIEPVVDFRISPPSSSSYSHHSRGDAKIGPKRSITPEINSKDILLPTFIPVTEPQQDVISPVCDEKRDETFFTVKGVSSDQPEVEKEPEAVMVTVTHIKSPSDFYVRPSELDDFIERIEYCLKLMVEGNLVSQCAFVSNGDLVMIEDEGRWKRGSVASLSSVSGDYDLASVFLLDYGSNISAPLGSLYRWNRSQAAELVTALCQLPQTVFHCALDGVKPSGMGGSIWSLAACREFGDETGFCSDNSSDNDEERGIRKDCEAWVITGGLKFTSGNLKDRIPVRLFIKEVIPADVFTVEGRKYVSLNKRLIERGLALSEVPLISEKAQPMQLLKLTKEAFNFPLSPEICKFKATRIHEISIDILLPSVEAEPLIKQEACYESECKKEESTTADDVAYFRRVEILELANKLPVVIENTLLHSINVGEEIFNFVDREAINKIAQKCKTAIANLEAPVDNFDSFTPGTFAIAYDSHLGCWARAFVCQVVNSDEDICHFKVYFLDSGKTADVASTSIRIPDECQDLVKVMKIPVAHYPLSFVGGKFTSTFCNKAADFVEELRQHVFILKIFALHRDRSSEGVDSYAGVSAYLGEAVVSFQPASSSGPRIDVELGQFMLNQTLALDSIVESRLLFAYPLSVVSDSEPSDVVISHAIAPDTVWVQRRTEATESAIIRMRDRVAAFAESNDPPDNIYCLKPSMPLIVCWPIDGGWYRASCLSVNIPRKSVHVLFVDYGNDDHVPLSCCRLASSAFCRTAPFTFQATLSSKALKSICFEDLVNSNRCVTIVGFSKPGDVPILEFN